MRPILLKNFLRSNALRGRYVFESRAVPTMLGIAHPASPTLLSNQSFRTFTTASGSTASATAPDSPGLRSRLSSELKSAMKSRDTFTSTVLRSVLAEVYAADKSSGKVVMDAQIASILKKAIARRTDSASQYNAASRTELAAAEEREAKLIAAFLPPSMPDEQIEVILKNVLQELKSGSDTSEVPKRSLGLLLKAFYQQVDKSTVDGQIVKQKAESLLASS